MAHPANSEKVLLNKSSDLYISKLLIYIYEFSISPGDVFIKRFGSGDDAPGCDSAMAVCFADDVPQTLKDAENLIKEYLSDMEFDSEDPNEYNNRGLSKVANGDYHDAITDFSNALYLNPEYAEAYSNRGNAKCAVRDEFAAEYDFLKAIKFEPQNEKYQNKIDQLKK